MADDAQQTPQETLLSLDEQINKVLATADEAGKLQFDEGTDPLFKRACVNEQKARVNQANFTKGRQEIASLKATNEVLATQLSQGSQLTAEQTEELEELKHADPDKWYEKKREYEEKGRAAKAGQLEELTTAASQKALEELTLTERKSALADFQTRTGIVLTDDIMVNDIPPRLQSKIGTMAFEEYLTEVAAYLGKGKVVKPTDEGLDQTNLEKLSGGDLPAPKKKLSSTIL